ncbi:MAG: hypothetical protein LBQ22_13120 [Bacteroidales bacterium]|jgi:hypothetical protein|nr:hypothetical protein [Bacteroidales bacterium]
MPEKKKNITQLGNPALIAGATTALLNSKQGQQVINKTADTVTIQTEKTIQGLRKAGKVAGIVLIVGVGSYVSYKSYIAIRRNQLKKKALSNPEIKTAIDLWECIPDGYKNKWSVFTLLNPLSLVSKAYEEIETLWKDTNTKRLLEISENIYKNQYSISKISRYFKTLYGLDLITILNKVLTGTQLDSFSNYITRGSASITPQVQNGLFAFAKQATHLRENPEIPTTWSNFTKGDNVKATTKSGQIAGQVTGREHTYTNGKTTTIFVELMAYDSSKNDNKYCVPVWAWKGGFDFLSKEDIKEKYGNPEVLDLNLSFFGKVKTSFLNSFRFY